MSNWMSTYQTSSQVALAIAGVDIEAIKKRKGDAMQYGKKITHESYEKGKLTATKHEYEVPVMTSQQEVLKDLIDALAPLTKGESTKLCLEIRVDKLGRWKLVKRWKV